MSPLTEALRAAWSLPRGRAGLVFLGFLVVLATAGPSLLPDPFRQFDLLELASSPPSAEHPFGTDPLSRDVLSRVVSAEQKLTTAAERHTYVCLSATTVAAVEGAQHGGCQCCHGDLLSEHSAI